MEEYKKLFRRDKKFNLCLTGAVALILIFGLLSCQMALQQISETDKKLIELYGAETIKKLTDWSGTDTSKMLMDYAGRTIIKAVFTVVILAQFIKWNVLEGKKGQEYGNLLPVKSVTYVTYDYICGILFLWVPVVLESIVLTIFVSTWELTGIVSGCIWKESAEAIVIVSFLYSLLIFAKKITRYVPGIFLTVTVVCGAGFLTGAYAGVNGYLLLLIPVAVFVVLSYWCDKKRDIAGNGLFYFPSAHFIIMGVMFLELFGIFANCMIIQVRAATYMISLLLAGAVTVGIHYLTWGRTGNLSAFDGKKEGKE